MILHRSLTEDFAEILAGSFLSKGSLHEELANAMNVFKVRV